MPTPALDNRNATGCLLKNNLVATTWFGLCLFLEAKLMPFGVSVAPVGGT
jgi:hypothetical protein